MALVFAVGSGAGDEHQLAVSPNLVEVPVNGVVERLGNVTGVEVGDFFSVGALHFGPEFRVGGYTLQQSSHLFGRFVHVVAVKIDAALGVVLGAVPVALFKADSGPFRDEFEAVVVIHIAHQNLVGYVVVFQCAEHAVDYREFFSDALSYATLF